MKLGAAALFALALFAAPVAVRAQAAANSTTTIVTFSERAERTLPRDKMAAELAVEASDSDARRLQDTINRRMAAALARANAAPNVTVATTGYNVYEVHPDKGPAHWEGRQVLRVESKDSAGLLSLVGALQADGLAISSLAASVSTEAQRAAQDELTAEALHLVAQRAQHIATTLDMRILRYETLHVGNTDAPPRTIQPMMRAAAAAAPLPPAAAAGQEVVSVSVDAAVELAPQR